MCLYANVRVDRYNEPLGAARCYDEMVPTWLQFKALPACLTVATVRGPEY